MVIKTSVHWMSFVTVTICLTIKDASIGETTAASLVCGVISFEFTSVWSVYRYLRSLIQKLKNEHRNKDSLDGNGKGPFSQRKPQWIYLFEHYWTICLWNMQEIKYPLEMYLHLIGFLSLQLQQKPPSWIMNSTIIRRSHWMTCTENSNIIHTQLCKILNQTEKSHCFLGDWKSSTDNCVLCESL